MTLLVHPGFHKTGTSWLQEQLFTDQRLFNKLFDHQEIWELVVRPHDFRFDPEPARAAIAARRSNAAEGRVDVISSEILCGNPLIGQRDSRVLADRLAAVTGPARIVLTVRAQGQILKSTYLQYVKRGGRMTLRDFVSYSPEPGYFFFAPELLEFHHLVEHYALAYGADNVLVLPQEILFANPPAYMRALVEFATSSPPPPDMEIPARRGVGKSPPASGIPLLRLASHFRRTPLNTDPIVRWETLGRMLFSAAYRWSWGEPKAGKAMQAEAQAVVRNHFGPSNDRLQRFCPFDLSELGYAVGQG